MKGREPDINRLMEDQDGPYTALEARLLNQAADMELDRALETLARLQEQGNRPALPAPGESPREPLPGPGTDPLNPFGLNRLP
jgi:hypothetical protein